MLHLPLLVMEKQRLFEHAARHGVRDVAVDWVLLDGGNSVNDAMMAGTLDFAGAGAPGFIELARARGIPNVEVIGISGLSTTSLSLNANRPGVAARLHAGRPDRGAGHPHVVVGGGAADGREPAARLRSISRSSIRSP